MGARVARGSTRDVRSGFFRGTVVGVSEPGAVDVELRSDDGVLVPCDVVSGVGADGSLVPGDAVLLVIPEDTPDRGCVLGRIATPSESGTDSARRSADRALPSGVACAFVERFDETGLWVRPEGDGAPRPVARFPRWSRKRIEVLRERREPVLVSERPEGIVVLGLPAIVPADPGSLEGERLVVEGKEEVCIRVGRASIVLRADGEIRLIGTRLVSRAKKAQKFLAPMIEFN